MASEREHAQSEFMCIASRRKCVNIVVTLYLLYLLFQENKSFGAITICIHPLMNKKPCREQKVLPEYTVKQDFPVAILMRNVLM